MEHKYYPPAPSQIYLKPKFCYCPSLDRLPIAFRQKSHPAPPYSSSLTLCCMHYLHRNRLKLTWTSQLNRRFESYDHTPHGSKFFWEKSRFMLVHQFKIPKKTRGLSIANLWCKEFGHSFLLLVPNKNFFPELGIHLFKFMIKFELLEIECMW
jgi:hypothetical protein